MHSQHRTQHQQLQQAESQRISSQEAVLREINNRATSIEHALQQAKHAHNQRISQQEVSIRDSITRVHGSQLSLQESVTDIRSGHQRLELKLDAVTAVQIAGTAEREIRRSISLAKTPIDLSRLFSSTLPTQGVAPFALMWCTNSCTCICHRRRAHRTPRRLQDFLGSLFLGYSGMPIITPTCDSIGCTARSSPKLLLVYAFPAWVLARAFLFIARLSMSHGLELNIRLPRVLQNTSNIWKYTECGDLESVKELLQKRQLLHTMWKIRMAIQP